MQNQCPRCHGTTLLTYGELSCINCGWTDNKGTWSRYVRIDSITWGSIMGASKRTSKITGMVMNKRMGDISQLYNNTYRTW